MQNPSPGGQSFQGLLKEEALRGERLASTMRWWFMGAAFIIVALMVVYGRYRAAGWAGMALLGAGLLVNAWLARRLKSGLLPIWLGYVSATMDLTIISAYQYLASLYASPLAVATGSSFLLYPLVLFYVALRHKRSLLAYAVLYAIASSNLAYYLRYPDLDPALLAQVYAADPPGMALRSLYLLMFGISLYFLPWTIRRLVNRQAQTFEEQGAAERRHRQELENQVAQRTQELQQANQDLQNALDEVKALSGLLPICTSCKKIRDDQGYWQGVEEYISSHTEAQFTHGICPECLAQLYPEVFASLQKRLGNQVPPTDQPKPAIIKDDKAR